MDKPETKHSRPPSIYPGFEDLPTDTDIAEDNRGLVATFGSWLKHSAVRGVKDSGILSWKKDLEWALKADLHGITDEEKKQNTPPNAPPAVQPRRIAIPERPLPPSHALRRSVQPAPTPVAQPTINPADPKHTTVDINLSLPSLPKLPSLTSIRQWLVSAFVWLRVQFLRLPAKFRKIAIAAVLIIGVWAWLHPTTPPKSTTASKSGDMPTVTTEKIEQKPTYATVAPTGKSIESLGGWKRVSPPDRNPVFAFADKIGNTSINVSEQPLPDSFKSDTESAVTELAKGYNATEKVTVGSIHAYIGTSAQGPQSVIFTKSNLLILIKSTEKLTTNKWAEYINSLK